MRSRTAAEVTKKTLYDRFGSKDRLIAAYLEQRNRMWHAFLDDQLARRQPETPEEVILVLFAALTDWLAESRTGCGFINASVELAAPDHPGDAGDRRAEAVDAVRVRGAGDAGRVRRSR